MADKFIMVDMNDDRTSKIAEVLGNKTCKNILGIISENDEQSSSDISSKLNIPLNTVDYNLKKLIAAGLVEENKSFFWSVKGRKIKTYKAANKKIIISTKPKFAGVIAGALLFGVIGFSARLFGNIASVSRSVFSNNVYSNDLVQTEMMEKVASSSGSGLYGNVPSVSDAATVVSGAPSNALFNLSSLFSNTLIWFLVGAFAGLAVFLLYKQLKGGRNKL